MKVVVVGAGASGLIAAVMAAEKGHRVTILEHMDKVGSKILATGNGRCNLTNTVLKEHPEKYYIYDSQYTESVSSVFDCFSYSDTIEFFERIGLVLKDRSGLVYPFSDQAQSVVDVLRLKSEELGVEIKIRCKVTGISKNNSSLTVKVNDNGNDKIIKADRVIVATGSKAQPALGTDGSGYTLLKNMGHKVTAVRPGLVQLKCEGDYFKAISGVRTPAHVKLVTKEAFYEESGELQLTAYGVSGIVIMNLSNYLNDISGSYLEIDLMENYSEDELMNIFKNKCMNTPERYTEHFLTGILNKKLGMLMMDLSKIGTHKKYRQLTEEELLGLVKLIKRWVVYITDTNSFKEAQICIGGIELDEVTDKLESKIVPGVFITGELLNVHGPCGGYNLQWAWSTGALTGMV